MIIERGGFKSVQPRPCDSCKLASAALFCRQDSAFLCISCDSSIHCATKLASSLHERVWMCQVCEQVPAAVTCKADAAALCVTCDSDIHSANPLARRHERVAVEPFFDAAAAAWLIPNPKLMDAADVKSKEMFFSEMDPFLDFFDYSNSFKNNNNNDRVVPVQTKLPLITNHHQSHTCFDISSFTYPSHSLTQSVSVSSSSLDVGVVPDGNTVSYSFGRKSSDSSGIGGQGAMQMQLCEMDREARVLRYREKRKNRKFHKTIRYASRKAYAETRPRIKGRFAKRTEVDRLYSPGAAAALMLDTQYGVVPSF